MKYSFYLLPVTLLLLVIFPMCDKDNQSNEWDNETFDSINRPFFTYNNEKDQYILEPWNYDMPYNSNRNYPLVVFLHGSGGAGNISYLSYLGYDNPDDNYENQTALDFQKNHPCFVLIPQTYSGWDYNSLIEQVEEFKEKYRIDTTRIYLIGYSMGGSGSYAFMNRYYDYNKHIFAGLIRLAGQSQTEVRDAIAENTGIWLHIGLNDDAVRVDVTRQAYQYLFDYFDYASETIAPVTIPDYGGTTYTLTVNGWDRFKRTEYVDVGHGIVTLPFRDPYVMEWLFSQRYH